jgi:S-adenosylmethionine synthetase
MPTAKTNPVNLYGETKRDGELAVLGVEGAKGVVLRVPVLYVLFSVTVSYWWPNLMN